MKRIGGIVFIALLLCAQYAGAACVTVDAPITGSTLVRGDQVPVLFTDICTNRWFECLQVDGANVTCGTPNPQQFFWNTGNFSKGLHNLTIRSFDKNGTLLGSALSSASLDCVAILQPRSLAAVAGDVPIFTDDRCTGKWYENLLIDGTPMGSFSPGKAVWSSEEWADGFHTVTINSQSTNPGSVTLGKASHRINVENHSPNGVPTPTPGSCLKITSPVTGSVVRGDFPVHTSDTCSRVNHEQMFIDGQDLGAFVPNTELLSSDDYRNGKHTITVQAHTAAPAQTVLATISAIYDFQNAVGTPTPVPTSGPTPVAHFFTQPNAGAFANDSPTAPTDAQCAAKVGGAVDETIPLNMATHADDLHIGITTATNLTKARAADLSRLAQFKYSISTRSNYFWFKRITGQYTGPTWNIFRFVACKYGIDEDAVKAQATTENGDWVQWHAGGDRKTDPAFCKRADINLFGYICSNCCYQSWGDFQTKVWYEYMTWPMMEYSTIFSAEYRMADQRACMDGALSLYFEGRGTTYATDAANYKSNPNGASPHSYLNPITGRQATNQDWMLQGCLGQHYSGGWWDSGARSYLSTYLLVHWKAKHWITPN